MKKDTTTRVRLTASDGMILTDGVIYGRELFLATTANRDAFYEITQEEYEEKATEEVLI